MKQCGSMMAREGGKPHTQVCQQPKRRVCTNPPSALTSPTTSGDICTSVWPELYERSRHGGAAAHRPNITKHNAAKLQLEWSKESPNSLSISVIVMDESGVGPQNNTDQNAQFLLLWSGAVFRILPLIPSEGLMRQHTQWSLPPLW